MQFSLTQDSRSHLTHSPSLSQTHIAPSLVTQTHSPSQSQSLPPFTDTHALLTPAHPHSLMHSLTHPITHGHPHSLTQCQSTHSLTPSLSSLSLSPHLISPPPSLSRTLTYPTHQRSLPLTHTYPFTPYHSLSKAALGTGLWW